MTRQENIKPSRRSPSSEKRPIQFCACGDHAWAVLTQGYVALFDTEHAADIGQHLWHAGKDTEHRVCARRTMVVYFAGKKRNVTIYMHRQIFPTESPLVTDHRNRNTLDNRSRNLRAADKFQSAANRDYPKFSLRSSVYRGVSKLGDKWAAFVSQKGHGKYLGTFATELEAARVYDVAARTVYGEFAVLNFPNEAVQSHRIPNLQFFESLPPQKAA